MDSPLVLIADKPDHPAAKSYLLYNDDRPGFVQMNRAVAAEIL